MSEAIDRNELARSIVGHLAVNPRDHALIAQAVALGMSEALAKVASRASASDAATMMALMLASKSRISPEMQALAYGRIAAAIDPSNASGLEREFLAHAADATGAA